MNNQKLARITIMFFGGVSALFWLYGLCDRIPGHQFSAATSRLLMSVALLTSIKPIFTLAKDERTAKKAS